MDVFIRVNGRGNAWPLDLGAPANKRRNQLTGQAAEYANTSLSIRGEQHGGAAEAVPDWEVLFDAGQGVIPFLVQRGNRFPDAVILSHPHFDHVAGLDWLVQNYSRYKPQGSQLPVFASLPCWEAVMSRFPYLRGAMEFRELRPGASRPIDEAPGVVITAYPVFHGDFAPGAMLVVLDYGDEQRHARAVFTGDLLCPLLRQEDWGALRDADVVYVDANTRFPWPRSGHWSIVRNDPDHPDVSAALSAWTQREHPSYLVTPHARGFEPVTHSYLDQFLSEAYRGAALCWNIVDFARRLQPKLVQLVHYSGYEDLKYHRQAVMTDRELADWTRVAAAGPEPILWSVPGPGDRFPLTDRA